MFKNVDFGPSRPVSAPRKILSSPMKRESEWDQEAAVIQKTVKKPSGIQKPSGSQLATRKVSQNGAKKLEGFQKKLQKVVRDPLVVQNCRKKKPAPIGAGGAGGAIPITLVI